MNRSRRTARALAALRILERHPLPLCAHCEGLLLAVATGRPLPMTPTDDGELIDTADSLDAMLDRLLLAGCPS